VQINGFQKNCRADSGITLIELVLVLMGAAILLSAGIPSLIQLENEWTLWGGVHMLEVSLQWGRMHAVSTNSSLLFAVEDSRTFCWMDPVTNNPYAGSMRQLPAGLSIVSYPQRPLRFYPHGNAAPSGTYKITGATGSYSVVVTPGGRIRVQRN
jgi:Tfp pilus assembly protein FimT